MRVQHMIRCIFLIPFISIAAFAQQRPSVQNEVPITSTETGSDLSLTAASPAPCNNGCDQCTSCSKPSPPNPCSKSHKTLFFTNDFSYLKDPDYSGCCLGDGLKLMSLGDCGQFGTLDVGGQIRFRYHHEKGMAQTPGLTRFQGGSNDFLLTRTRLYADWRATDWARIFVEGIYAGLDGANDYAPRGIDENYGDILNAFVDLKLTESSTVRVGRQELLYGAQRTVSPLDWANTRRTFEGINFLYRNCDWALDAFYTNLVPVDDTQFDEADYDRSFYGLYGTYSGIKNHSIDLYYLGYDNETTAAPIASDFSLHTLGLRLNGSCGDWLYEIEGAPQFGRQSGLSRDHIAGFATIGMGRKLSKLPWSPTVWLYYDYASGNNMSGDFNRYNQLFPLAHKYLGFIDATQRSNIESPNILLTMKPTPKLNLLMWYYHLMANTNRDIVPSIGGTPAQSGNSKDWGDELDILASYSINPRSNVAVGWSHFWAGNKISTGRKSNADFYYVQWTLNF